MVAFVGRIIFAIPLWITARAGRQILRFFTELLDIGLFRAKWYITIVFWTLLIWVLVQFEPWIRQNLGPVNAAYWRIIVGIMLLSLLALRTAKLRRRWRRAKIEIQILHSQRGNRGNGKKGGKTSTEELERVIAHNEARGDPVPKEWYERVARAKAKREKERQEEPEPRQNIFAKIRGWAVKSHTFRETSGKHVMEPEDSYEAIQRQMKAEQQVHIDDLLAGKVQTGARREPWNLGLDKKPRRHGTRRGTPTEPPQKQRMSQQVQRDAMEVGDNLEFDGGLLGMGQIRAIGKITKIVDDPITNTPTPIVVDKNGKEWVVGSNTTIYRHWK